jgi:hypothetical protein
VELHLPRSEILRQVRASLGIQTDASLGSQSAERHIVAVNQAALKVQQECAWVNAQARTTVDLEAEQDTLNYPEGTGPGSVRAMSVYDADAEKSFLLDPRIIPVQADKDQQQAAGGDLFKSVQGRPRYYEQRDQIKLWPWSDKPYKVRIDYLRAVTMPTEGSISIVDAMLIIYAAASMLATQRGDDRMAAYYGGLYTDRKNALMAWQSQGTDFSMSTEADLGEDEMFDSTLIPQWDRRPTINGYNSGSLTQP